MVPPWPYATRSPRSWYKTGQGPTRQEAGEGWWEMGHPGLIVQRSGQAGRWTEMQGSKTASETRVCLSRAHPGIRGRKSVSYTKWGPAQGAKKATIQDGDNYRTTWMPVLIRHDLDFKTQIAPRETHRNQGVGSASTPLLASGSPRRFSVCGSITPISIYLRLHRAIFCLCLFISFSFCACLSLCPTFSFL